MKGECGDMETNIKDVVAKLEVLTWPDIQFNEMALNNEFRSAEVEVKRSDLVKEIYDYGKNATLWKLASLIAIVAIAFNLILTLIFDINDYFLGITVGLGMTGMIAHYMYTYAAKDMLDRQVLAMKLTELDHKSATSALDLCKESNKAEMWRKYTIERRGDLLTGDIDVLERLAKIDKNEQAHEELKNMQQSLRAAI